MKYQKFCARHIMNPISDTRISFVLLLRGWHCLFFLAIFFFFLINFFKSDFFKFHNFFLSLKIFQPFLTIFCFLEFFFMDFFIFCIFIFCIFFFFVFFGFFGFFLDFWDFLKLLKLFEFFGGFFCSFGIPFKVTEVTTKSYHGYYWTPKMDKNGPKQHRRS